MYIPERFNHLYGIPLIMEVGSLNTKIGYAGKDRPDIVAPSVPTSSCSMSRPTRRPERRLNLISTSHSPKKTAILRLSWRTASSRIGRDFRHWQILTWAKRCSSHHRCAQSFTSSPHSAANSIATSSSSSSSSNMGSMDFLCTKPQSCPLICLDLRAL